MPRALSCDTRELAKALFIQGVRFSVISAQVMVKEATLRTWAKRDNWNALVAKSVQPLNKQLERGLVVESQGTLQAMGDKIREQLSQELLAQVKLLASRPPSDLGELATVKGIQGRASVVKTIAETAAQVHGWDSQASAGLVLVGDLSTAPEARPVDISATVAPAELADTPTDSVEPDPAIGNGS